MRQAISGSRKHVLEIGIDSSIAGAVRKKPRSSRWLLLAALLWAPACKYMYYNDPIISSIQSRSQGGCYSRCSPGWRCNSKTGLCDEVPQPSLDIPVPTDRRLDGGT
jgi:hypothetical protein